MTPAILATLLALSAAAMPVSAPAAADPEVSSVHQLTVTSIAGDPVDLARYKGRVMLVVNTASKCGFTPQYAGLETLFEKYAADGLAVLGFPSNDFGGQEPGTNEEVQAFCKEHYGVGFDLFAKGPVSGPDKQPLYAWLVANDPDPDGGEVKWNFEKFLVSRDGKVLARFRSRTAPDAPELVSAIEAALAGD